MPVFWHLVSKYRYQVSKRERDFNKESLGRVSIQSRSTLKKDRVDPCIRMFRTITKEVSFNPKCHPFQCVRPGMESAFSPNSLFCRDIKGVICYSIFSVYFFLPKNPYLYLYVTPKVRSMRII